MKTLIMLFLSIFFGACTHVRYTTHQKIPVYYTQDKRHQDYLHVEEKIPFFLFGLYPKVNNIYLDEIAIKNDFKEISKPIIYERPTWDDLIFSILSIGLYTPRTMTISALGVKK